MPSQAMAGVGKQTRPMIVGTVNEVKRFCPPQRRMHQSSGELVHHPASRFLYSSGNTRLASLRLKVQLIVVFFRLRSRDQWEA